mmetsp:Transcript_1465/g.1626  ORF Transcript_1465/g.1626 Transcript_1465/m.1626 type:complete len:1759 (-) Transcript_1465:394-5670(-)
MFGASNQTPFGSPTGGFGQQAQQQPTTQGFGSPAPASFGQAPSTGGFGGNTFGAPPAAQGGFGGFGGGQPAQATSGFGVPAPSTGFGAAPSPSTGFGQQQQSNNTGFGAQPAVSGGGMFGAAPAPSNAGLFGSPPAAPFGASAPSQGGAFGASAPIGFGAPSAPTGFGAPQTNTGFGATPQATNTAFGAPSPSLFGSAATVPATTSLFGSAPPAPSGGAFGGNTAGFGANTNTSTFGASTPAPAPSAGMFGTPAQATNNAFGSPSVGANGGTRIAPFQPQSSQDGSNNILLHSITAMPQYANKSFEELRFEDYSQGNKGSATTTQSGAFGTQPTAVAGGLFGAAPVQVGGGLFNNAPVPATGGFGTAPAPSGSLFGSGPTQATASTAFGAPTQTSAFGVQPVAPGGGLFGAAPAPVGGGLFGAAPAPATTGFGTAPAPTGGLFGLGPTQPAATTAFGTPAQTGSFGVQPAPVGGGLFGAAPAPVGGGLFGAAPAPSAFAPTGGGLFGSPAPVSYGTPAPPPTSGFFGAAPAQTGGGLFGQTATSGVVGQHQASSVMVAAPPLGSVIAPIVNEIMTSQLAALDAKRKELEEKDNFRNNPSRSSAITAISQRESRHILPVSSTKIPTYRVSPSSHAKIRPRGFASPQSDTIIKNMPHSLSKLGRGGKPMAAPETVAAASRTNLTISPAPKPRLKLTLSGCEKRNVNNTASSSTPGVDNNSGISNAGLGSVQKAFINTPTPVTNSKNTGTTPTNGSSSGSTRNRRMDPGEEYYREVIGSPGEVAGADASRGTTGNSNGAPTLSKVGYSCNPSIVELQRMDTADLAAVANFSVVRKGVGKVEWEGAVDVRGANLDLIVVIEHKSVSVYTEEEEKGLKPKAGTKLNRPAKLTMENVFPKNAQAPEKFKRKIADVTMTMGAELINYDLGSGEWVLLVQHFSRYALDDDDSDDEEIQQKQTRERKVAFEVVQGRFPVSSKDGSTITKRQDTPYKSQRNFVPGDNDHIEVSDDAMLAMIPTTDIVMTEASIMEEAETAFNELQMSLKKESDVVSNKKKIQKDTASFPEENSPLIEENNEISENTRYIPTSYDLQLAESMPSFSSELLKSTSSKNTSSSVDFGLRMGKSFRVGWGPNGSFLSLGKNGVLVRSKPKFEDNINIEKEMKVLENHRSYHEKVKMEGNCPLFSLPSSGFGGVHIEKTLESYSEAVKDIEGGTLNSTSKSAFSLLKILHVTQIARQNNNNNQHSAIGIKSKPALDYAVDNQCMESITRWFIDSCSPEVDNEIRQARSNQERYKAFLSSISGGDLSAAAKIAEEENLSELSILLASGPEAKEDIFQEIIAWRKNKNSLSMPENLLRIYRLLAGDFGMEEDVYRRSRSFDWRRRMIMKLNYTKSSEACRTLSAVICNYEADVSKGVAPFPSANKDNTGESTLFRILKLGAQLPAASSTELSLSKIIDPLGYCQDSKNFSLSFHLTSCISAMYSSNSIFLTPEEEYTIIDGYAFQLQSLGLWEWAVYVFLCVLSGESSLSSSWRSQHAKSLILQNFNKDDESAKKRFFLESLEVPSDWFEEALCYRLNTTGDVLGYITHSFQLDKVKGTKFIERTLVPKILFASRSEQGTILRLIEELYLSEDNKSLPWAISTFFETYEQIHMLEGLSKDHIDQNIPTLLDNCEKIEHIFSSYKASEGKLADNSLDIIPEHYLVPMGSFLAEALHQTSHFKLQILAVKEGMTITSTASQKLKLLRAQSCSDGNIGNRENICRWLM